MQVSPTPKKGVVINLHYNEKHHYIFIQVNLLPADTLHYLIPLTDVVAKYLDILETSVFKGIDLF